MTTSGAILSPANLTSARLSSNSHKPRWRRICIQLVALTVLLACGELCEGTQGKQEEVIVNLNDQTILQKEIAAAALAKGWRGLGETASLEGQRVQGVKGMPALQHPPPATNPARYFQRLAAN